MATPPQAVNLAEKLAQVQAPWTPHIVADLNGYHVKVAKLAGTFVWHQHADTDELFFVVAGELEIRLRPEGGPERAVHLRTGELCVVPRGLMHYPVAHGECQVLLIEPAGTLNTGDAGGGQTVAEPRRI